MILTSITFMFLIGLLLGWFTGFNVYRLIFVELIMILIVVLLVSVEVNLTGSAQGSTTGIQQAVRGMGIFYILSGVLGAFTGMYLKHKSLESNQVDK